MAAFLNAVAEDEIVFGQNMTTITFHLSRSSARRFQPGDEIVLTRMDHDGNVSPWLLMARDRGLVVNGSTSIRRPSPTTSVTSMRS